MAYGKINVESAVSGGSGLPTQLVNYTMLYDSGDECTDVTGGWTSDGYAFYGANGAYTTISATKNTDNIYLVGGANLACLCGTENIIPLDNYASLNMQAEVLGSSNTTDEVNAHIVEGKIFGGVGTGQSPIISTLSFKTGESGIKSVDISSLTSDGYVVLRTSALTTRSGQVYNVFLVKEDNWQEWISKAGLSTDTYTTLDAVIADSTALETLMNNEAAVKYMLLNCTGTVLASVVQSDTALDIIRDSQYNAEIYANEHWNKFLRMVGEVPESEKTYLYNNGDALTTWTLNTVQSAVNCLDHLYLGSASITLDSDCMTFKSTITSVGGYAQRSIFTSNDLTEYSKIKVSIKSNSTILNQFSLYVGDTSLQGKNPWNESIAYKRWDSVLNNKNGRKTHDMDISNITGSKYIILLNNAHSATTYGTQTVVVDKIWLE